GDAALNVVSPEGAHASARCVEVDSLPGTYRMQSDRALDGQYVVSSAGTGSGGPAWSRRLTFAADAFVHRPSKDDNINLRIDEWVGTEERTLTIDYVEPIWDAV